MVKTPPIKYKKAPQAPRRFKSSYMFFSTEKHKSIRKELQEKNGDDKHQIQTTEIAKMVSAAWKTMPADERDIYEELARRDKARYTVERDRYTGPWKIPVTRRPPKDPSAPKRPMSAFLAFSNAKRAEVKLAHSDLGSTAMSRVLAKMWKEAPAEEKNVFIKHEESLREKYNVEAGLWRQKAENAKRTARQLREDEAHRIADAEQNNPSGEGVPQASNLLLTGIGSGRSSIDGSCSASMNTQQYHPHGQYNQHNSSSKPPPFAERPSIFPTTSDTLSSAAALTTQMFPPPSPSASRSSQYYPHPSSSYRPAGDPPQYDQYPSLVPRRSTPVSSTTMDPILPSLPASSIFDPPPFDSGGEGRREDGLNQYAAEGNGGYQYQAPQPYYPPPGSNNCGPPPPQPPHMGYYDSRGGNINGYSYYPDETVDGMYSDYQGGADSTSGSALHSHSQQHSSSSCYQHRPAYPPQHYHSSHNSMYYDEPAYGSNIPDNGGCGGSPSTPKKPSSGGMVSPMVSAASYPSSTHQPFSEDVVRHQQHKQQPQQQYRHDMHPNAAYGEFDTHPYVARGGEK